MSFKQELQHAFEQLGQHENLVYLTSDVGKSVNADSFKESFGERFINVGIAEQNAICMSAGLASEGYTVLLSAYAVFASGRGWELVRNYICYPRLNVKIIATHGGLNVGQDGVTHQATEDIAIMRAIPNMTVMVVADPAQSLEAIQAAIETQGPVYLRFGRSDMGSYHHTSQWQAGKSEILTNGNDVSIIASGLMVKVALNAAEALEKQGVSCRVIDMRSIKPLDTEAVLKAASETSLIVTAEDHSIIGGLYGAVSELLAPMNTGTAVVPVGVRDCFAESGDGLKVMKKYGLDKESIIDAVVGNYIRKGIHHA